MTNFNAQSLPFQGDQAVNAHATRAPAPLLHLESGPSRTRFTGILHPHRPGQVTAASSCARARVFVRAPSACTVGSSCLDLWCVRTRVICGDQRALREPKRLQATIFGSLRVYEGADRLVLDHSPSQQCARGQSSVSILTRIPAASPVFKFCRGEL